MDGYDTADGFRVFQCLKCCAVGTKNLAEATDTQEPVMRCNQCGSWQFVDQKCHTCLLIGAKLWMLVMLKLGWKQMTYAL